MDKEDKRMDYGLVLEQGLKQQLSQFQILSLNMLALDNAELEEFLENHLPKEDSV